MGEGHNADEIGHEVELVGRVVGQKTGNRAGEDDQNGGQGKQDQANGSQGGIGQVGGFCF